MLKNKRGGGVGKTREKRVEGPQSTRQHGSTGGGCLQGGSQGPFSIGSSGSKGGEIVGEREMGGISGKGERSSPN